MPDVGLTSSAERLREEYKLVIKYTIEIEGLPVYTESYDAAFDWEIATAAQTSAFLQDVASLRGSHRWHCHRSGIPKQLFSFRERLKRSSRRIRPLLRIARKG